MTAAICVWTGAGGPAVQLRANCVVDPRLLAAFAALSPGNAETNIALRCRTDNLTSIYFVQKNIIPVQSGSWTVVCSGIPVELLPVETPKRIGPGWRAGARSCWRAARRCCTIWPHCRGAATWIPLSAHTFTSLLPRCSRCAPTWAPIHYTTRSLC